jgi:hypothetical protein
MKFILGGGGLTSKWNPGTTCPIIGPAQDDGTLRVERQAVDHVSVPTEFLYDPSRGHVPQVKGGVAPARGEPGIVGGYRHIADFVAVGAREGLDEHCFS